MCRNSTRKSSGENPFPKTRGTTIFNLCWTRASQGDQVSSFCYPSQHDECLSRYEACTAHYLFSFFFQTTKVFLITSHVHIIGVRQVLIHLHRKKNLEHACRSLITLVIPTLLSLTPPLANQSTKFCSRDSCHCVLYCNSF